MGPSKLGNELWRHWAKQEGRLSHREGMAGDRKTGAPGGAGKGSRKVAVPDRTTRLYSEKSVRMASVSDRGRELSTGPRSSRMSQHQHRGCSESLRPRAEWAQRLEPGPEREHSPLWSFSQESVRWIHDPT